VTRTVTKAEKSTRERQHQRHLATFSSYNQGLEFVVVSVDALINFLLTSVLSFV